MCGELKPRSGSEGAGLPGAATERLSTGAERPGHVWPLPRSATWPGTRRPRRHAPRRWGPRRDARGSSCRRTRPPPAWRGAWAGPSAATAAKDASGAEAGAEAGVCGLRLGLRLGRRQGLGTDAGLGSRRPPASRAPRATRAARGLAPRRAPCLPGGYTLSLALVGLVSPPPTRRKSQIL
eukprot:scaffold107259_cov43-Phaeocystis_antarctica.AAC.2